MERRTCMYDIRAGRRDDGERRIEGYFAVFDDSYELWKGAYETVDPHAFDKTLDGDIRALINHNTTLVIGRTVSKTLTLRVDGKGLWGSILINPEDTDAVNAWARCDRGDISQCSFGFEIVSEKYTNENGVHHWTLCEVQLHEVSICTFPAYKGTSVTARDDSAQNDGIINRRKYQAWKIETEERIKKWH